MDKWAKVQSISMGCFGSSLQDRSDQIRTQIFTDWWTRTATQVESRPIPMKAAQWTHEAKKPPLPGYKHTWIFCVMGSIERARYKLSRLTSSLGLGELCSRPLVASCSTAHTHTSPLKLKLGSTNNLFQKMFFCHILLFIKTEHALSERCDVKTSLIMSTTIGLTNVTSLMAENS